MKSKNFAACLTEFLSRYLPELKNVSSHTISSYCDTFRLFLQYCQDEEGMKIEKLSLADLKPELVERFLDWLEKERKNSVATRNQRLAAIHSFVSFVQSQEPGLLLNFQRILDISVKKTAVKPITHLPKEAVAAILRQPDTSTPQGRRDATLLCVLYDTAARASELCALNVEDVRLEHPASIRLTGKGPKTRIVPLLPATVQNLKNYLSENRLLSPEKGRLPLFPSKKGNRLSSSGLRYILNKYTAQAEESAAPMPHVTPHVFRHSKAMHVYEAGNNLIYVRDFLGHTDVSTTGIYARTSLNMKRQALEKVSDSPVQDVPYWLQNNDMLAWLKSFGARKP